MLGPTRAHSSRADIDFRRLPGWNGVDRNLSTLIKLDVVDDEGQLPVRWNVFKLKDTGFICQYLADIACLINELNTNLVEGFFRCLIQYEPLDVRNGNFQCLQRYFIQRCRLTCGDLHSLLDSVVTSGCNLNGVGARFNVIDTVPPIRIDCPGGNQCAIVQYSDVNLCTFNYHHLTV